MNSKKELIPIANIADIRSGLLAENVAPILGLSSTIAAEHYSTLTIQSCPCSDLNVLTINNVVITQKDDKQHTKETPLLANIMISAEMAKELSNHTFERNL